MTDSPALPRSARTLWHASPVLAASVAALGVLAVVCLVGLAVDPRTLLGEPVWVKPLKFCVSGALYLATLAVLIAPVRSRAVRRTVEWGVGGILVVETALIAVQAFRGVRSHFNISTPFDALLFAGMGLGIALVSLLTLVAAVAVLRAPAADRLWKRAALWGLVLTLAGSQVGWLMTAPTAEQRAAFATAPPVALGQHTVGRADGGPGLPGVGWSTAAGDLRVPHFWGLHGLQALPLLALWLRRRPLSEAQRVRLLTLGGAAYAAIFGVLLQQALRGVALVRPDAATALAAVAVLTLAALAARHTLRPA